MERNVTGRERQHKVLETDTLRAPGRTVRSHSADSLSAHIYTYVIDMYGLCNRAAYLAHALAHDSPCLDGPAPGRADRAPACHGHHSSSIDPAELPARWKESRMVQSITLLFQTPQEAQLLFGAGVPAQFRACSHHRIFSQSLMLPARH